MSVFVSLSLYFPSSCRVVAYFLLFSGFVSLFSFLFVHSSFFFLFPPKSTIYLKLLFLALDYTLFALVSGGRFFRPKTCATLPCWALCLCLCLLFQTGDTFMGSFAFSYWRKMDYICLQCSRAWKSKEDSGSRLWEVRGKP